MPPEEMTALLDSWLLHLRAERKSANTLKSYGDGVRAFLAWAQAADVEPALTKTVVTTFVNTLLDEGREANTVVARLAGVRRFSTWLDAEGVIDRDELLGLKRPKVDEKVVPELSADQIKALLKTCGTGGRRPFVDIRDEAIIRFMLETAARAGEVVCMTVADTDIAEGVAIIRRGKGGKGRRVPFGPQTGIAIDRYVRARKAHRLVEAPALWLGDRGKGCGYEALYWTLCRRAERAGIEDFTPHVLRHTSAGRWLDAGGTEGGLMAIGGWKRREMIDRYTKATSERRAADESRRLNLGDF